MHRSFQWRRGSRGFSLVEVAIVVVCIGVLAALAMVGFIRYRRTARMAEATHLVSNIKAQQEAYKAEKGLYAAISRTSDSFYPAANPGKFTTAWGGDCAGCFDPKGWSHLSVHVDGPVMYGYATVAGVGADVTSSSGGSSSGSSFWAGGSSGGTDDDDSTGDNQCATIAPTQPYFLIKAKGDTDGDGVAATVLALSCSNQVIVTNPGE